MKLIVMMTVMVIVSVQLHTIHVVYVLVMIAAQKSRRYRTAIFLEDLEMEDGFDGGVYTEEYRRLKYPDGWT